MHLQQRGLRLGQGHEHENGVRAADPMAGDGSPPIRDAAADGVGADPRSMAAERCAHHGLGRPGVVHESAKCEEGVPEGLPQRRGLLLSCHLPSGMDQRGHQAAAGKLWAAREPR
jgi:hypothetical protein